MKYRELEDHLYSYNVIKMNIRNLEIDLSQLTLDSGISGISYEEKIPSGKISNNVENAVFCKIEHEERIEKDINAKKNLLEQIDNALQCLNPIEKEIVTSRYIDGKQWWEISSVVKYSEDWCKRVRKKALRKMLKTFNMSTFS